MGRSLIDNDRIPNPMGFNAFSYGKEIPASKPVQVLKRGELKEFIDSQLKNRNKPKKKRKQPEAIEQREFFTWLSMERKDIRPFCFSIPNGGKRDGFEAKQLRRQGLTQGVPDVCLALPASWRDKNCHGMYIEFKAPGKKSVSSPEQVGMIERLRENGYYVVVVDSWEEARDEVNMYLDRRVSYV